MSIELKTATRGGQTTLHALRMMLEVVRVIILWSLAVGLFCGILYFHHDTTEADRIHLLKWVNAHVKYDINPDSYVNIKTQTGSYSEKASYYLRSPERQRKIGPVVHAVWKSLYIGVFATLVSVALVFLWFRRRGKKLQQSVLLKGAYVTSTDKLAKHIRKTGKTSHLTVAGIPLYQGIERQHFLFHGSTGTGKTQLIADLLAQIREVGDKAAIYDKHGSYVEHFYRDGTDILLNPLDERGSAWEPWAEGRGAADFDHMAASLMPHPPGQGADPFWINAARTIFAATSFKMQRNPDRTLAKLLRYLFTDDLSELSTLLAGTEAASLVSDRAEKTALSVKSVLATHLKMLKYIKHSPTPFSIRQWVANPDEKNWLFISSRADKHESLKPLMSLWLDLAANALMSLDENPHRRLWLIVDELPSLQRLPYLPAFLAEGRKFGGCFVGGVQNYYQLQKIYGQDGAKELVDLCNTRVFFRAPSHESAQWVSKELGDSEVLEAREGISYGANSVRDGVSINHQRITKPAVSVSEINTLPDLHGFISILPLGQSIKQTTTYDKSVWPIGKFKLEYRQRTRISPGFIEVKIAESIEEIVTVTHPDDQSSAATQSDEARLSTNDSIPCDTVNTTSLPEQSSTPIQLQTDRAETSSSQPDDVSQARETSKVDEAQLQQTPLVSVPTETSASAQGDVDDDGVFRYRE